MARNIASSLFTGIATVAVAAAAAISAGNSYADDITIDTMPAVLSAPHMVIKAQVLPATDEWTLQHNRASLPQSGFTAAKAKADYAAARDEVRALNAEDSGAAYFKMPSRATSVMGAPAR
ncbi:hypothetical protein [Ramlibacter sp. WS9]|uniref:hypothetical protein n=1 Tax=Ramlibacter sp. WS9 TaxID=1882741 RepID=UPI0011416B1A|nr:hypothetical protein [Ramlibacter sp. WS9]ROZ71471.1 hypothetical protein EEB15_20690 [Ramlibacter sp. WS9]